MKTNYKSTKYQQLSFRYEEKSEGTGDIWELIIYNYLT